MPPRTSAIKTPIGKIFATSTDSGGPWLSGSFWRPHSGRAIAITPSEKIAVNSKPGPIPARNRSPMLCSVSNPYRISNRLGGISMPRIELPATTPAAKRAG